MIIDTKNPAPEQEVVQLNETLGKLEQLKGLIDEMPEMDYSRVAQLKKAIEQGTYSIHPTQIAQRILDMETCLKTSLCKIQEKLV